MYEKINKYCPVCLSQMELATETNWIYCPSNICVYGTEANENLVPLTESERKAKLLSGYAFLMNEVAETIVAKTRKHAYPLEAAQIIHEFLNTLAPEIEDIMEFHSPRK